MSAEVALLASDIGEIVNCVTCGIGIAVDIVGRRWQQPPYDWAGERFNHSCKVAKDGLDANQSAAVDRVCEKLTKPLGAAYPVEQREMPPAVPDSRLPPEKEDLL